MFHARDFVDFFSEMEMAEKNMRDLYGSALELINDKAVRSVFEDLHEAEAKHIGLVDKIRKIAIKNSLLKG